MAFMGMVIGAFAIAVLLFFAGLMLLSFLIAIILKIVGKAKDNKKVKTAGNVFVILGIVFALPLIFVAGYAIFTAAFVKVELPDGKKVYELSSNYYKMIDLAEDGSRDSLDELDRLLDKHPNLIYCRDANYRNILDYGVSNGNAGLVELAIEHGAVFDDPARYDMMSYVKSSMEDFMNELYQREITDDDIEIISLMFEEGASTELYLPYGSQPGYSNIFGEAVWIVMYNDYETELEITDNDLKFLNVFIDNGYSEDPELITVRDVPSNYMYPDGYYQDIRQDANYSELMSLTGLK